MGARILIVDDEKQLVHGLQQVLLPEFPGSSVDAAYSGEEALSCLAKVAYDLIIADLRMPGFDGLELIKGVRYLYPDVPVILMTGYGSESIQAEATKLGVKRYIDKPFDIDEMVREVSQLLPEREQAGD